MGRVKLKIPPWVASMLNTPSSDWLILEKEIGKETTIGHLLAELALGNPEFQKAVFDPDTGKSSGQVMFFLNKSILRYSDIAETKLNDGDSIMLLPVYPGG
ncbi:MoaD/ThiS family protein [Chloroflexota bacterium]